MPIRAFKTKAFAKWASDEGLSDDALASAAVEIAQGLIDAHLGGKVVKKRVGLAGRGRRGGARTLVAFQRNGMTIFIYGFAKNERINVSGTELRALKLLAKEFLSYPAGTLRRATEAGELIEIEMTANG